MCLGIASPAAAQNNGTFGVAVHKDVALLHEINKEDTECDLIARKQLKRDFDPKTVKSQHALLVVEKLLKMIMRGLPLTRKVKTQL